MDTSENAPGPLVGCSVRGPKHVESGTPCQDAWDASQLDEGQFLIAVGDGLGSAELSHKGSEIATKEAVKILRRELEDQENITKKTAEDAIREAVTEARTAVFDEADNSDAPPSEYDTTLLVAVADSSGVAGAVVGDGGIICAKGGSYELLVPRENVVVDLPASNITIPLLSDNWENSYRFGYCNGPNSVAVFSDGLENFTWSGPNDSNPEFFDAVFNLLRKAPDPVQAKKDLVNALQDDPYKRFGDDKTIVLGDLPPISETEKVATRTGEVLSIDEITKYGTTTYTAQIENSSSEVVKIFDSVNEDNEQFEEKINAMVETTPGTELPSKEMPAFAWPTDIVAKKEDGSFIGYKTSVPDIEMNNLLVEAENLARDRTESEGSLIDHVLVAFGLESTEVKDSRYEIALNLAILVQELHRQGHGIGDFHHTGIQVHDEWIYIKNCESFHIRGENGTYAGDTASARYRPPEGIGDTIEEVQQGDRFGLAVHLFQLFMHGNHPFQADGSEATSGEYEDMIDQNPFPYRDPQPGVLEPPADAPSYSEIPAELRSLFGWCFIEGKHVPEVRPTAESWVDTLKSITGAEDL